MIGKTIRFLRKRCGLSQGNVAERLGLKQSSYSKYEMDINEPNITILRQMANLFNVSVDFLINESEYVDGQRLLRIRNYFSYSQQEVAHYLQVATQHYIDCENNLMQLDEVLTLKLALLYGIDEKVLSGKTPLILPILRTTTSQIPYTTDIYYELDQIKDDLEIIVRQVNQLSKLK